MLKRSISKISGIIISALFLMCSLTTAFAADELSVDSNTKLNIGDEFTYTLYLADSSEPVEGIQMYIFYDKDYLEVVDDSVVFNTLEGAMFNTDLDSFLTFNWATPMPSYAIDYSGRTDVISLNFRVLKSGDTQISYFIKQLYGEENPYLKSYTLTYDISVNGRVVSAEQTPVVNSETENINQYQGYFINYIDGMGEDNTPDKDNHPAVIGQTATHKSDNENTVETTDSQTQNMTGIIVTVVIVLLLLAVAGVLILKRRDDKNKTKNT